MAQKVTVLLVDDVDGTEASQTVPFSLDGYSYEIDLSDKNADALRLALDLYVRKARQTGRSRGTRHIDRGGNFGPTDRPHIRAFAEQNGLPIPSDRGRISKDVGQAWVDAGRPRF